MLHIFDTTEHSVCLLFSVSDFAQSPTLSFRCQVYVPICWSRVDGVFCSADLITNMSTSLSDESTIWELAVSTKGCPSLYINPSSP